MAQHAAATSPLPSADGPSAVSAPLPPSRSGLGDVLLAVSCGLVSLLYVTVALHPGGVPGPIAIAQMLLAFALTAAALFWRVRPRAAGCAIAAMLAGWAVSFWAALPIHTGLTPYLLLAGFVVYAWTRWVPRRRWEAAAGVLGVIGAIVSPGNALPTPDGFRYDAASVILQLLALAFVWLLARHHRGRDEDARRAAAEAHEREEAAAQAREQRALAAAQAERQRIAAEIHDVLAHSLTLIHARSTAGLITLEADPLSARDALSDVRSAASDALAGVRSLVGALASPEGAATTAPAGDLRDVPALLDRFRAAGLAVTAEIPTPAELAAAQERLPVLVRLAVLRLLEEALTNTLRHGDPAAGADLALALEDPVRIVVSNSPRDGAAQAPDAPAALGTGTGLTGLAARVADLGGTLRAGPTADGFELTAQIPHRPAPSEGTR